MNCPFCLTTNFVRKRGGNQAPLSAYNITWRAYTCLECNHNFISLERVPTQAEAQKLAELVEASKP